VDVEHSINEASENFDANFEEEMFGTEEDFGVTIPTSPPPSLPSRTYTCMQ
jgi:hypothetical protein